MKDKGSRKQQTKNSNKVKEKEKETCVGKDVREETMVGNGRGIVYYQSEICQSVPSHSTHLPALIPSPSKRLKALKQASFLSSPADRVNFPPQWDVVIREWDTCRGVIVYRPLCWHLLPECVWVGARCWWEETIPLWYHLADLSDRFIL